MIGQPTCGACFHDEHDPDRCMGYDHSDPKNVAGCGCKTPRKVRPPAGLPDDAAKLITAILGPRPKLPTVIAFGLGIFAGQIMLAAAHPPPVVGRRYRCLGVTAHHFESGAEAVRFCPTCAAQAIRE